MRRVQPNYAELTASAGIACYAPHMGSPNDLLIAADHALYEAKLHGPDSVRIFAGAGV
jgi:GGDEF domain-containing protein